MQHFSQIVPRVCTSFVIITNFHIVIYYFSFYANEHNLDNGKWPWGHHQHRVLRSPDALHLTSCERSELSSLFNARIFYIIYPVRRAVNVLNVSTCI